MKSVQTVGFLLALLPAISFAAGDKVDETRDVSLDGYVEVIVLRGSVHIEGWDKPQVKVVGTLDERTKKFIFEVQGDTTTIEVRVEQGGMSNWFGSSHGSELTIYVPHGNQVEFEGVSTNVDVTGLERSIEVNVVSGDVDLVGGGSRIEVQTVSGNVELRSSTGRVDLASVSGDITAGGVSGKAEYNTVSGNIRVQDAGEELSLESVSGDVTVTAGQVSVLGGHSVSGDIKVSVDAMTGSNIEFESVSGNLKLMLGGNISSRFDLDTGSGDIRNELTDDTPSVSRYSGDESLRFTIGDGDGRVVLSTQSGDITIGKR